MMEEEDSHSASNESGNNLSGYLLQDDACSPMNGDSTGSPLIDLNHIKEEFVDGELQSLHDLSGGPNSISTRHEKSLGLLTTRFVSLLQESKNGILDLKMVSDTQPHWSYPYGFRF